VSGEIFDQHRFTVNRLKESGFNVLVVIGSERIWESVPIGLELADVVIAKGAYGFDFSGYSIGLRYLVRQFGEVDVLILNDSVFGPFGDLRSLISTARWRLTGFTSSTAVENHIQGYAFFFRKIDQALFDQLRSVFLQDYAFNVHAAVAFLQETRLARIASKVTTVGTFWKPAEPRMDLTMACPVRLVKEGFPFLKRSLLGKFSVHYCQEEILATLRDNGHPVLAGKLFAGFGEKRFG
jgi:hypothetical protein